MSRRDGAGIVGARPTGTSLASFRASASSGVTILVRHSTGPLQVEGGYGGVLHSPCVATNRQHAATVNIPFFSSTYKAPCAGCISAPIFMQVGEIMALFRLLPVVAAFLETGWAFRARRRTRQPDCSAKPGRPGLRGQADTGAPPACPRALFWPPAQTAPSGRPAPGDS
jgi:hypothetical protein